MGVERASRLKWHRAIVNFFGLKKGILVLLAMVILVGSGEKMAERFLPLYLVALGGGAFSIGLAISTQRNCNRVVTDAAEKPRIMRSAFRCGD